MQLRNMGKLIGSLLLVLFLSAGHLFLPSLACSYCTTPSPSPPPPTPCPPPPSPPPPKPSPSPPLPKPTPRPPPPPPPEPKPSPSPSPSPPLPSPPPPKPTPRPPPPPPPEPKPCPIDTLKLDACVDVLGGLVHAIFGRSATDACCPVIGGLADLDAALCLCTTIRAKVLSINVVLSAALEVLIDCGKRVSSDYECPVY